MESASFSIRFSANTHYHIVCWHAYSDEAEPANIHTYYTYSGWLVKAGAKANTYIFMIPVMGHYLLE